MKDRELRDARAHGTMDPRVRDGYTARMQLLRTRPLMIVSLLGSLVFSNVRAETIGKEIWIGGGVSWPVYHDLAMACIRGGISAVFVDHVMVGISGQADRDRIHYFGDAGVIFPLVWGIEPYARFQAGRRDDRDDTALGWAAGFRLGDTGNAVKFFVEGHGIVEPEENNGISAGISF